MSGAKGQYTCISNYCRTTAEYGIYMYGLAFMSTLWVMGCNLYSMFLSGCIKETANHLYHLMIRLDSVVT